MKNLVTLANKEFKDRLRNTWVISITLALMALALLLSFLAISQESNFAVSALSIASQNLITLSIYFIPLIALLIAHDNIVGESEDGTLLLILTYPISRISYVIGKYLGQLFTLSISVFLGFALGFVPFWSEIFYDREGFNTFALLVLQAVLFGAVFLSIGMLLSLVAKSRSVAVGYALLSWLGFVIFYDFGLIALISTVQDVFSNNLLSLLILANPVDSFRVLTFLSLPESTHANEVIRITQQLGVQPMYLFLSLLLWICVPLVMTIYKFNKKEV